MVPAKKNGRDHTVPAVSKQSLYALRGYAALGKLT